MFATADSWPITEDFYGNDDDGNGGAQAIFT